MFFFLFIPFIFAQVKLSHSSLFTQIMIVHIRKNVRCSSLFFYFNFITIFICRQIISTCVSSSLEQIRKSNQTKSSCCLSCLALIKIIWIMALLWLWLWRLGNGVNCLRDTMFMILFNVNELNCHSLLCGYFRIGRTDVHNVMYWKCVYYLKIINCVYFFSSCTTSSYWLDCVIKRVVFTTKLLVLRQNSYWHWIH